MFRATSRASLNSESCPEDCFVNVHDLLATSVHNVKGCVKCYALLVLYLVAELINASPRKKMSMSVHLQVVRG